MAMGLKMKQLIQNGVDAQEPFRTNTGSVRGYKWPNGDVGHEGYPPMGRLPEENQKELKLHIDKQLVRYAIYSFGTPIAWVLTSGIWIVPDVYYTVTTSHHQGVVRTAIANYDFYNKVAQEVGSK